MQVYGNSKLMVQLFVPNFQRLLSISPNEQDHKIAVHTVDPGHFFSY